MLSKEKLVAKYKDMWDTLEIKEGWKSRIYRTAKAIAANKDKYIRIAKQVNPGMPWYFVGIIHNMECGLNFGQHLHNGDSLQHRTHLVPAGRPVEGEPPFTFEESALDALRMKGYDKVTDWSFGSIAYLLVQYNGLGYEMRGIANPYLWSGSTHYVKGKFVADHVFDSDAVSEQIGAMLLVKAIIESDKTETYKEASKKSRRLNTLNKMDAFFSSLGVGGILSWTFIKEVKDFVTDYPSLIILTLVTVSWLGFKLIKFYSANELKEGRYQTKGSDQ